MVGLVGHPPAHVKRQDVVPGGVLLLLFECKWCQASKGALAACIVARVVKLSKAEEQVELSHRCF